MRKFIPLRNTFSGFEEALMQWASGRDVACILKSNSGSASHRDIYSAFEMCVAADEFAPMKTDVSAFEELKNFHHEWKDWLFGFFAYDLKNEIENLKSENADRLKFPVTHFYCPKYIFQKQNGEWNLGYRDEPDSEESIQKLLADIYKCKDQKRHAGEVDRISQRVSKSEYLQNVDQIQKRIQHGDIYEMNYCVEFYAEDARVEPISLFEKLVQISPMPFSCFYKMKSLHVLCASPERFIAKRGNKIISQPIKGTARRGASQDEDEAIKTKLFSDKKERSENVMIVDLVRNDLSRTAKKGSVKVEELFGIHTFKQLHQMVSTVISEKRDDIHFTAVIRNAFPMGSMTGAPKVRAMQLIEEFETTRRGMYSGSVGYITPDGDFDFNVVIRSILYNQHTRYLSFMVGSAITISADPEKEYEECLLKAKSMMMTLKAGQKENLESIS